MIEVDGRPTGIVPGQGLNGVSSVLMAENAVRAWVIRWEWSGRHAAVEQPVAAVLRPQLGGRNLLRIVEALYAARE